MYGQISKPAVLASSKTKSLANFAPDMVKRPVLRLAYQRAELFDLSRHFGKMADFDPLEDKIKGSNFTWVFSLLRVCGTFSRSGFHGTNGLSSSQDRKCWFYDPRPKFLFYRL